MRWETELCGSKSCRWNRMDLCCTVMCLSSFALSLIVVFTVTPAPKICDSYTMVSRDVWKARGPESQRTLSGAVNVVFIHHTGTRSCTTNPTCKEEMRVVQSYHMDKMGMSDIGYSFVVGENGWVYEARGWGKPTEHITQWDDKSVSIAIMGDFNTTEPNKWAMGTLGNVLKCGVENGHLSEGYKLLVRQDEDSSIDAGPGKMLYDKLKEWDHYSATPGK